MLCMRKPGSNVSLQIVSFHQLSDAQALDLDNPIQRALVEMGDSEIGEPVLDLNVLGVNISSHYVNSIVTASKIIAHLESIGINEPTIMEIGSGIGLLGVALKKWFGSKVTLIFSDLPETLEHSLQRPYVFYRNIIPPLSLKRAYLHQDSQEAKPGTYGRNIFLKGLDKTYK